MATLSSIVDATVAEEIVPGRAAVLFFWARWHEQSCEQGQMGQVAALLPTSFPGLNLVRIEAEESPGLSSKYDVQVVPTFIFINASGAQVSRVEGANPPAVAAAAKQLSEDAAPGTVTSAPPEPIDARLARLVKSAPVMLFMKGNMAEPRCKFSREFVEILSEEGVAASTFDILQDEEVRQGLKKFSNWYTQLAFFFPSCVPTAFPTLFCFSFRCRPTYPQLYVNGELIGGLDIIKEMRSPGPLKAELGLVNEDGAESMNQEPSLPLEERLKGLISQAKTVLFMKGEPAAPKCGFSRKICGVLNDAGLEFTTFDILQDEEVRQGLKKFSNWYSKCLVKSHLRSSLRSFWTGLLLLFLLTAGRPIPSFTSMAISLEGLTSFKKCTMQASSQPLGEAKLRSWPNQLRF